MTSIQYPADHHHTTGVVSDDQPICVKTIGINKLGTLLSSQTTGASGTRLGPHQRRFAPEQLLHLSRSIQSVSTPCSEVIHSPIRQTRINLTTIISVPVKSAPQHIRCRLESVQATPRRHLVEGLGNPTTRSLGVKPVDQLFRNTHSLSERMNRMLS